jgi:uncharacterized protein YdaU (DUF1376 family)
MQLGDVPPISLFSARFAGEAIMRAFLLDVDAWLSSTDIAMMTAQEERGYLRLLLHAWKQDDCGLPDDDDVLAHLSLIGSGWQKSAAKIRKCFESRDGRLYNARLLKEWEYQRAYHARQADAAAARWAKQPAGGEPSPPKPRGRRATNAAAMPTHKPPHMPRHDSGTCHGNPSENTAYAVETEQTAAANSTVEERAADAAPPPPRDPDLAQLGKLLRACMSPGTIAPDAAIVRQVADAIDGYSLDDVAAVLQDYRRRGRRPPKTYGFWPLFLGDALRNRGDSGTAAAEVPMLPPTCNSCGGSGVVDAPDAQNLGHVRAAIAAGKRLCGCQIGDGWAEMLDCAPPFRVLSALEARQA